MNVIPARGATAEQVEALRERLLGMFPGDASAMRCGFCTTPYIARFCRPTCIAEREALARDAEVSATDKTADPDRNYSESSPEMRGFAESYAENRKIQHNSDTIPRRPVSTGFAPAPALAKRAVCHCRSLLVAGRCPRGHRP